MLWIKTLVTCWLLVGQEQADLDSQFLKERIRKIHGDFVFKLQGEWKASLEGRTETWKWTADGWRCGTKEQPGSCASWTPSSFEWMGKAGVWWQNWSPEKKDSLELSKPRNEPRPLAIVANEVESGTPDAGNNGDVWGHNLIGEIWTWKHQNGITAHILISARDQRIERIVYPTGTEYFEWTLSNAKKTLELSKLVMERDGVRVSLQKSR